MPKAHYPIAAAPYWPFAPVWRTDHCARDWASFWNSVAISSDPMEVARARGGLARHLLRDSLAAWAELALVPMRVWGQATEDRSVGRLS